MSKAVAAITDFRKVPRIFSSFRPFPKPSYRSLGICADLQLLSPEFLISIARRSYVKLHAARFSDWVSMPLRCSEVGSQRLSKSKYVGLVGGCGDFMR